VVAGAGVWEALKVVRGESVGDVSGGALIVGVVAALVAGLLAIEVTLRFLRTHPVTVFVIYRVVLAAVVLAAWLALWDR
jgi:undecaprenyl pyrophosphate phosphatase UppP